MGDDVFVVLVLLNMERVTPLTRATPIRGHAHAQERARGLLGGVGFGDTLLLVRPQLRGGEEKNLRGMGDGNEREMMCHSSGGKKRGKGEKGRQKKRAVRVLMVSSLSPETRARQQLGVVCNSRFWSVYSAFSAPRAPSGMFS